MIKIEFEYESPAIVDHFHYKEFDSTITDAELLDELRSIYGPAESLVDLMDKSVYFKFTKRSDTNGHLIFFRMLKVDANYIIDCHSKLVNSLTDGKYLLISFKRPF